MSVKIADASTVSRIAHIALAAVILLGVTKRAVAEESIEHKPTWEFLVASGTLIPTGAQRDVIQRADLTAAQLAYVIRPDLAISATLGWVRSRDIASVDKPKLDIFTYDLGAEVRSARWNGGRATSFSSFAGLGVGARTYSYRYLDVDATHNIAGYVSAGGEFGAKRVRIRLEARDYVTGFKPLNGHGTSGARNDVVVVLGLRIAGK
jgi:hypothetical protein